MRAVALCIDRKTSSVERKRENDGKTRRDVISRNTKPTPESNLNVCSIREIETLLYPKGGNERR